MFLSRRDRGSNLVEYVIPTAIFAASVGLGIFYLSSNGGLLNGILSSSAGSQSLTGGKLGFGSAGMVDGIYKDSGGNINLCNKSGSCVFVPEIYYNKYGNELKTKLDNGEFESNTSSMIGTETSGAVGVENVAYSDDSGLNMYASLLDLASEKNNDTNAQELLDNLSAYGQRIDNIENNLLDIKEEVDDLTKEYEAELAKYLKAKQIFEKQMEGLEGTKIRIGNISKIKEPLNDLNAAYEAYSKSRDKLKVQVDGKMTLVDSEYSDLKDNTGQSFDKTIVEIEDSAAINQETKDLVLPVSKKMSAVKDSVEVIEQEIQALTAVFDSETETYEDFNNVLWSFNITIDYDAGDEHVKDGKKGR